MNKKIIVGGSVVVGVLLLVLAVVYWCVPAESLPSFFPGYEAGSAHIHFKHGLGAFILALALFAHAWFKSAPASHAGPTSSVK